ncbi:MAG: beta-hydroxyacyl-ACP dehydratase [Clostridia bacterium]|nr:beta-hydroxyacyl-ACP dehydratase [Clostridia bacterium]
MERNEIMTLLPHRGSMLLLDSVCVEDGVAKGLYTVRGDEWFLDGHFPGNPIVPGVVLCEILAQSACVLLGEEAKGVTPLFAGLDNVRFKQSVRPGDAFETQCVITKARTPFYLAQAKGFVKGALCVSAEFSFVLK